LSQSQAFFAIGRNHRRRHVGKGGGDRPPMQFWLLFQIASGFLIKIIPHNKQIIIRFISKVTFIIQRRNAYQNMQFCYVTNILTQWNIPRIWSGKRTGISSASL